MDNRRTVLITGGARGIGAEIAKEFAQQGDQVILHYGSSTEKAEAIIASLSGTGHVAVQADIRNPAEIATMVESVGSRFGKIDVLINNAGVFIDHPIESTTYEEWQSAWDQVLGVNLIGAANMT